MVQQLVLNNTPISGVHVIERKPISDPRGFFSRLFCAEELAGAGWIKPIIQINHTYSSAKGTLRGLHFQHPPKAEMKLVICLKGSIYDVAIDLRRRSATFLKHHHEVLSSDNYKALLIPEGCAHGFQALTDDVEILYLHNQPYSKDCEAGFSATDIRLGIAWPLAVSALSERDSRLPVIPQDFKGLSL